MSVLPVSDMTYWRGAALEKLQQPELADQVFRGIAAFADELEAQEPKIDYFATSLPAMLLFHEDLAHRNRVLAAFLRAQAAYGCNGAAAAIPMLRTVLALDSNHAGASDLLQQIELSERDVAEQAAFRTLRNRTPFHDGVLVSAEKIRRTEFGPSNGGGGGTAPDHIRRVKVRQASGGADPNRTVGIRENGVLECCPR